LVEAKINIAKNKTKQKPSIPEKAGTKGSPSAVPPSLAGPWHESLKAKYLYRLRSSFFIPT
jgi:hypothetical protein